VSLVENDGTVTKINEPGPELDYTETGALISRAADTARAGDWVVGAGSLPQGVAADFYVRLADAMPRGIRVAIDADGAALRACLGCPIALLKPNRRELETLVGRALATLGEVVTAAREVVEAGADTLLVSLGQDGAVLVGRDGAVHAEARITDVRNNVGAGDALLAGFLAAGHDRAALPVAVAWAVAACRSPGTAVARVTDRDFGAVTVQDAVGTRRLAA
jgi:1-phosphofructokinase